MHAVRAPRGERARAFALLDAVHAGLCAVDHGRPLRSDEVEHLVAAHDAACGVRVN